ncbi:ribokinase [Dongia mobilis]|uniref:Ribokinase n=1 Tax=Dongia mobilis TaxID=578943 RepID=A0A4V3DEV1_9PROT|nr:ribokinase [Dongia mobilis]TDQ83220.1 ribokinase [Dongia mobilis]
MNAIKSQQGVVVLGIFVADLAFMGDRMPKMGETIAGSGFKMGPGGKGSNQSVAAARAGAKVTFVSKIGRDAFGEIAQKTWAAEGIDARVGVSDVDPSGVAFIHVNDRTGENAIIVYAGAAGTISPADVDAVADAIRGARVFVTQLEQPVAAAQRGLEIARAAGVTTVFNPAPAEKFPDAIYPLCDFIVPNESEAAAIVGFELADLDAARRAGDVLLRKGVRNALITLGERGALLHGSDQSIHIPATAGGKVIDTAGAGDAFVGGFAAAIAEGMSAPAAVKFGCATAGISVTRRGTAPAMPLRAEIDSLLAG